VRIQKISGPRLHASWVNIPHVTQFDEADITELEEVRTQLKQKALQAGIKLTPLAFIVRACVKALQEFPLFNSSLDPNGANLILKKYIHVGFAADTPTASWCRWWHDANRKDIYVVARQLVSFPRRPAPVSCRLQRCRAAALRFPALAASAERHSRRSSMHPR